MKNINKSFFSITVVLLLFLSPSIAAPVGSSFTYQGELFSDNQAANGSFDIKIAAYDTLINGINLGIVHIDNNVIVTNGVFTLQDVDLGDIYDDGDALWLKISVKKTTEANYTTLSPRQRLSAVPYSDHSFTSEFSDSTGFALTANVSNLTRGLLIEDSQQNDILKYIPAQGGWVPVAPTSVETPWVFDINNNTLHPGNKKIGIGVTAANSKLHINSSAGENALRVQIASSTKFIVNSAGRTGINTLVPSARLEVKSSQGESPLKIKSGVNTRMLIDSVNQTILNDQVILNGNNTYNGTNTFNDQVVHNDDLKQLHSANGLPKYLIEFKCGPSPNHTSIIKQQNNTTTAGNINILNIPDVDDDGFSISRCTLTFPSNSIDTAFFTVNPIQTITLRTENLMCETVNNTNNKIECFATLVDNQGSVRHTGFPVTATMIVY